MSNFKWFRGLRGRLTVIMTTAAICIICLNLVTYFESQDVSRSIDAITKIRMPSIKGLEAMNEGQTAVMQAIALIENTRETDPIYRETLEKMYTRYADKRMQINDGFKLYEPLPQTPDEADEYTNTFVKVWREWENAADSYITAKKKGDVALASQYYSLIYKTFSPSESSLFKIISINYKNAEDDRMSAEKSLAHMNLFSILFGLTGLAVVIIFSIIVAVRTTNSLSNLTVKLSESSSHVASSSTQIASSAEELSQATTEQASSLEETAASLEQISAMITKASDSASATAESSAESQQKATEGRMAADEMMTSMDQINQSNDDIMAQITNSNQNMNDIIKVIQEIGTKTKIINEIVFQTKLLSFNASVEAARAGEHGKGFAIVAEEVGKLAEMSGSAAKEISDMLAGSITKVEEIVVNTKTQVNYLTEQSKRKIDNGLDIAKRCSDSLSDIVQQVSKVTGLAQEISNSSKEQAQGILEINKAMAQLDTVTQQNASTSEEAASSAEELSSQAIALKHAVQDLVLTIEGQGTTDVRYASNQLTSNKKRTNNITQFKSIKSKSIKKTLNSNFVHIPPTNNTPSRDDIGFKEA